MSRAEVSRSEAWLAPETLAQLATLELRARMIVEGTRAGRHRSPRSGLAVEFDRHRSYEPGDEMRHVDWKVLGRTDRLVVKQFQQETNLDVIVVVDCSSSMRFGTLPVKRGWAGTAATHSMGLWTKYDTATALAAALAWMGLQQSDRVGTGVFADDLHAMSTPSGRRGQWKRVISVLSHQTVDGPTKFAQSCATLISRLHHRSLIVVLSDLLVDIEDIQTGLARMRHVGHDIVTMQTLDRMELRFEYDGDVRFEGLESDAHLRVNPRDLRSRYLDALEHHIAAIGRICADLGCDHLVVDSHESVGPALARLLAARSNWARRRTG